MTIEYVYQLLGMKEVELNATRMERDQLKAKLEGDEKLSKELNEINQNLMKEIAELKAD